MVRQVVGRDQELEAAARFFDDLGDTPAALVFAGEPGIGKTTLWAETLERARENGFVVLAARGGQAEAKLAFAALSALARQGLMESTRLHAALKELNIDAEKLDPVLA